ncbi:PepSY domain-containing protein [Bradyrhizobium sp. SSUT77]|uniref:PepSY domain-containing protein n=1 Tax=Bradyrhizobium sp. SSUT77 TaxID=3040603 RepID=UPI002446D317|nr:PepSY domain-containing protein [Bradyrhizobium sp. SSUT77]MDH2347435.1 PepSY domain-containing protein [Bradyrhizobium sp. SSUT77]
MERRPLIPEISTLRLVVAFLLLLTCVPSYGHARGELIANSTEGQEDSNVKTNDTVGRELKLFRTIKVSIRTALAAAKSLHAGSRVVDVSFDGASGTPIYRVKTYRGNQVWDDAVDANSGAIVGGTITSLVTDLTREDQTNLIALNDVRQEIADGIVVAERNAQGRAISGGLMNEDGKLKFVIVVVAGNDLKQFILEPPHAAMGVDNTGKN